MDFALSNEHKLLRESAQDFAERVIRPRVRWMEETDDIPWDVIKEMGKRGFIGVCVPQEYGGTGQGHLARMIIVEEIGKISAACAFFLQIFHLGIAPIVDFGSPEQKARYLPSLARGERLAALALTETTGGSDPGGLRTKAKRRGDLYVLNGKKVFITNAHVADTFIVVARTSEGRRGVSALIVDKNTPGFRLGRKEQKFGIRGCNTGQLIFENAEVPAANLLSEEGRGLGIAFKAIGEVGRTGTAGCALGVLHACLETATRRAKGRKLYGRPIAELQGIQWPLAEIYLDLEIAKLLCYRAAWLVDRGGRCDGEIAAAKFHSTEAAVRSAKKTVDIYGGYGYLDGGVPQRLYRDAECLIASAGTSEVMRIVMARVALSYQ